MTHLYLPNQAGGYRPIRLRKPTSTSGDVVFLCRTRLFSGRFGGIQRTHRLLVGGHYKAIYSPKTDGLHTYKVVWKDGTDACLPAEAISFEKTGTCDDNHKLLGLLFFEEVREEAPGIFLCFKLTKTTAGGSASTIVAC